MTTCNAPSYSLAQNFSNAEPAFLNSSLDSKALSTRIFWTGCITLLFAKLFFAFFYSWLDFNAYREFGDGPQKIEWPFFINIAEFGTLPFAPMVAWAASRIAFPGKSFVWWLIGIGFCQFAFTAGILHYLHHLQVDFFTHDPNRQLRPAHACYQSLEFWIREFLLTTVRYFIVVAPCLAIRYWMQTTASTRQTETMKRQVAQLRYELLTNRLQPHFLFNTLNTISALTKNQPEKAQEVIGRLGELLRKSLDSMDETQVSLNTEYSLLRDYLEIQKVRFGDCLTFSLTLPPSLEDIKVALFILQPLVENSVKHGLDAGSEDCSRAVEIHVQAEIVGDSLQLTVSDNGAAKKVDFESIEEHLGLGLTRERLRLQYGEKADVTIGAVEDGFGFSVILGIPLSNSMLGQREGVK